MLFPISSAQLTKHEEVQSMVAYEFYLHGEDMEEFHLLGILPERRKNPLRITQESIVRWGQLVAGDSIDVRDMYFIQIEI